MPGYAHSQEHLLAELQRITCLIRLEVLRCRGATPQEEENGHGLYITAAQVDALLAETGPGESESARTARQALEAELAALEAEIAQRTLASVAAGTNLRLERLRQAFQLTPFEINALLLSLAPDIALHYETLYAYLQDDVTRKRPSLALLLRLLCPSEAARLAARQRFMPGSPLRTYDLLHLVPDPTQSQASLLSQACLVEERLVHYLLGADDLDTRLTPYVRSYTPQVPLTDLLLAEGVQQRLEGFLHTCHPASQPGICFFQGPYGVGKQRTAEACCTVLGQDLLVLDTEAALRAGPEGFASTVRLALREAQLRPAALYMEGVDALLTEEQRPVLARLLRSLEAHAGLVFLAASAPWEPADALGQTRFVSLKFLPPTYAERLQLWQVALQGPVTAGPDVDLPTLANRFRLSGGQIRDAVATAAHRARWRDPASPQFHMAELTLACRLQSNRQLATLAHKLTPHYTWDDLILPADRLQQLREICQAVTYRAQVYDAWGFDRKLSLGKGLTALFAGPRARARPWRPKSWPVSWGWSCTRSISPRWSANTSARPKKISPASSPRPPPATPCCSLTKPMRCLASAAKCRTPTTATPTSKSPTCYSAWKPTKGWSFSPPTCAKTWTTPLCGAWRVSLEFPFPTASDRRRIWARIWPRAVPS